MKVNVTIGFDGFLDEMIKLVSKRESPEIFESVGTIADFGKIICESAGHSTLREIVVTDVCAGGCAINMGDGVAALGASVKFYGTVGFPEHSAFKIVTQRFERVVSVGDPGKTYAFEFNDGKTMFSSTSHLVEVDESRMKKVCESFFNDCKNSQLIGLTNWSLYPNMTAIWKFLIREVFSKLMHLPTYFFDLVDPSTRIEEDILNMLLVMPEFSKYGYVILSLNLNEANILARVLKMQKCDADKDSMLFLAKELRLKIGINEVIIHNIKVVVAANENEDCWQTPLFCKNPVKTTGAGDRFNAGYSIAASLKFSIQERVKCGVYCGEYFVRNGRSASWEEMEMFLKQ